MPTALPITSTQARPVPRLTIGDTIRFFWLLGRSRWLLGRLEAAHRRLDREKTDAAGDGLLRAAERWLATHEEIGALLKVPLPPAVDEMREVLGLAQIPARRAASETQEL